ncbi:MAG: alpha/beta hydrolase [Candidatus Andeanibacterium colombiense]|uniref:Alpha/beta hydrolase n=1 Tax=Candidatus Andeanibacterium colombiense TaxID=3121345 RepID=A0AAJ5X638_9SPHN|nr:MAG: alpha/beta hydrolase [Sphingomonadaceae bacterium]
MASEEFQKLAAYMAANPMPELGNAEMREQMDAFGRRAKLPAGMIAETPSDTPVPARLLTPANAEPGLILFAHGGGFTLGSIASHAHVAAWLGEAARCAVLIFDYRLAPEHPFPAALHDYRAVYRCALDQGTASSSIAFAGDSAGANLSLSVVVNGDLPLPGAVAMLSPSLDLAAYLALDPAQISDKSVDAAGIAGGFRDYIGSANAADPRVSPNRGGVSGLPPLFVQLAKHEVFAPEALAFAERVKAEGGAAEIDVWEEMVHDWHWYAPRLPEAREALERAGAFIRRHLA